MSQEFDAIYENGVLRPLKPVEFREHEVVTVCVTSGVSETSPQETAAKQREILSAFANKMEALIDEPINDGLTNRDHDRILYGRRD
jgi:predicted DNA-binding antitoxin AbrB/MazE fold protein